MGKRKRGTEGAGEGAGREGGKLRTEKERSGGEERGRRGYGYKGNGETERDRKKNGMEGERKEEAT